MNTVSKTVWITGASSGIGESLAYAFTKQDYNLIISGRNVEALNRVKQNCHSTNRVEVVPLDISNHSSIASIAQQVLSTFGTIDILVNNAGVSQRSLAADTSFEVDKSIIDTNLLGTIALTKAVLPTMIQNRNGHVVVISSLMGKFGTPLRSSYAASKHGLHGFFDCLRAEIKDQNIKVTIVCPGYVRTNISINALTKTGEKQATMDEKTNAGLNPDEVANRIIKAIKQQKEEVNIGGKEILMLYVKRFFPTLFSKIISKVKSV